MNIHHLGLHSQLRAVDGLWRGVGGIVFIVHVKLAGPACSFLEAGRKGAEDMSTLGAGA